MMAVAECSIGSEKIRDVSSFLSQFDGETSRRDARSRLLLVKLCGKASRLGHKIDEGLVRLRDT